ncbi:MAG: DUF2480 family protein [Flavobacteriales bacterium]|jgi:hypothetical protein|nr:DUF2480 family protein [Flavobacteriales bacterium]
MSEIINKVAASGLITLDLEDWYPTGDRVCIDIANQLWQGLALREKDFREWIKTHSWEQYRDAYVAVYCSVDAIVPNWAFMLVASALNGISRKTIFGTLITLEEINYREIISKLEIENYRDKRVVIKGCSNKPVPVSAYVDLLNKLQPVAKSIMFGEPCSTVPVFKR